VRELAEMLEEIATRPLQLALIVGTLFVLCNFPLEQSKSCISYEADFLTLVPILDS